MQNGMCLESNSGYDEGLLDRARHAYEHFTCLCLKKVEGAMKYMGALEAHMACVWF